jgi:hypothetical protein
VWYVDDGRSLRGTASSWPGKEEEERRVVCARGRGREVGGGVRKRKRKRGPF